MTLTWARQAAAQARRQPLQTAAGALVLVAAVLSSGATWAAWHAQVDADAALDRLAAEQDHDDAVLCVRSWSAREDIRDAVERGTRGGARVGAEAIIAVADTPDPADVADYRAAIDRLTEAEVDAARAEIPDPECDLAEARELLNQER